MWVMACATRWMPEQCCSSGTAHHYALGAATRLPPLRHGARVGSLGSEEAGLLCRFFQGLPAGSNARYKGIASLTFKHGLTGRILSIDSDKRLGNLLH